MRFKTILIIIIILVIAFFAFKYLAPDRGEDFLNGIKDKLLNLWEKIHQRIVQWWKEKALPKIKEWLGPKKEAFKQEFEKEKEEIKAEIGEGLKESFLKIFSGAWDFIKDIF